MFFTHYLERTFEPIKNNYTKAAPSEDPNIESDYFANREIIDTEEVIRINQNDCRPNIRWNNKSVLLDIAEHSDDNIKINFSEFSSIRFDRPVPNLAIDIVHYLSNLTLFPNRVSSPMKKIHWQSTKTDL